MMRFAWPLLLCCLALSACKFEDTSLYNPLRQDVLDRDLDLDRRDYLDIYKNARGGEGELRGDEMTAPPIPDMAPILAAPDAPKLGKTKLVTLTVTDDVELKDVLIELARLADVDIEIDAGIRGGVSFRAKDRPFSEVIERIADLAGLRYNMKGGVLRIERDTPYVEIYPIDFMNIERSSTSNVAISTNVLSGGEGGGGSLNTGSSSAITATTESDFWGKLEDGIKQILTYSPASMTSNQTTQATEGGTASTASSSENQNSFYTLNRQGGNLTASATAKQHSLIKRFLKEVERTASAQVLIEAKVVEITLNRDFESGIDWAQLGNGEISFTSTFGGISDPGNLTTFNVNKNNFLGAKIDLDLAVRLSQRFGTTRTLSSPRLHAINNQQAVLTFAENQVYFEVEVERETTTSTVQNSTITVNSEIKTVPIGIILVMQPSINLDSQEVTLNVRPTLSRVTGFASDPAVAFLVSQAAAQGDDIGIQSQVPIVEVRELDSILKLKSGQVMVIGGLMEQLSTTVDEELPYTSEIPILGNLFKGVDRQRTNKELVIFIRATIIGSDGNVQEADKRIYNKFTNDPRPLEF